MHVSHRIYLLVLAVVFSVIWAALAVDPLFREDWMLENFLVVGFAAVLVVAVLTGGLVALAVYAWVRGRGPLLARVALTVVMLPAVGFAVLLGAWGWLGVLL